jgi:YD repeat-containing protein
VLSPLSSSWIGLYLKLVVNGYRVLPEVYRGIRLQQVTDPTGTYGFAYDNMGRLVGTTTQYAFLSGNYTTSYTYDANSNRLTTIDPQSGVTNYTYDTLNRLSTLTPPTAFSSTGFGFPYDALSRRTQMTRPNGVNTNYSYDNLSRLLSVLHQVGTSNYRRGCIYVRSCWKSSDEDE